MQFNLSERQTGLRKAAHSAGILCSSLSFAEMWKAAAAQGLTSCVVPAEFGGGGLNAIETAVAVEGFSEGCKDGGFTFSIAAHLLAGVIPLVNHGSDELKKRMLPKISANNFILANAMTESSSGSNAFAMKTRAGWNGKNHILTGTKIFCTNAPVADAIVVYALTDENKGFFGGITCFLLEKGKHNYSVGKPAVKTGLISSPMSELFFDAVEVGEENIVGKKGGGALVFMDSMNWERTIMSAMHAGVMSRLCDQTRGHVKNRMQDAVSLEKHQGVQFRLAEMFLQTEICRLMAYKTAALIDAGENVTAEAARTKIFSSEAFDKVAREAFVLHGANALMQESGIGSVVADAQAALIYSGPNDVLRNLVASGMQ